MLLLGLTKTTLLDYPGKVAATVFTGGCNFRCPFCHNGQLVTAAFSQDRITEEEVFEHLKKRKNVLGGVCVTGGEPTIQADLPEFIIKIKELGYSVKLDTNGSHPNILSDLIDGGHIDYVAMDIKNTMDKYSVTAGCSVDWIKNVNDSISILKDGKIPFEFRTTVVKQLHTKEDLEGISEWISGGPVWYIQSYKDSDNVIKRGFDSYTKIELEAMIKDISKIPVVLRGID